MKTMKSIKINTKAMVINDNQWQAMKINKISMKSNETQWQLIEINENHEKSMKIYENQYKSI